MTDKHLFIGQNESTRADKIKNLINSFSIENKEVISYDLEEVDFDTLYEDLISPPFLTEKKIIIIYKTDKLYEMEAEKRKISLFLEKQIPDVIVIFSADKLDNDKLFKKQFELFTEIHRINNVSTKELRFMIEERLRENSIMISDNDKMKLIELLEKDHSMIKVNLDKVITFAKSSNEIFLKDIIKLLPEVLEENIYMLVGEVLKNNTKKALKIYYDLLKNNIRPERILSSISRRLMEIEDIKIYLDNNKGQDFIAEKMNMSRGRAYYSMKEAKSINLSFLKMNIDEISELDYKIKSGKIEKKIGLELYIVGGNKWKKL